MKLAPSVFCVLAAALLLQGCTLGGLLNRKSAVPQATSVPTGGNLAMPPDLQLATPGTATYRAPPPSLAAPAEGVYGTASAQPGVAAPTQDVYTRYGISVYKPDGTRKTKTELDAELKAAMLAEKRRTNPGYGTFRNIGAIFTDG